jgi:hypothetical protein
MRVVAFLTEYAVVDLIIRHLELTFVAEKPRLRMSRTDGPDGGRGERGIRLAGGRERGAARLYWPHSGLLRPIIRPPIATWARFRGVDIRPGLRYPL